VKSGAVSYMTAWHLCSGHFSALLTQLIMRSILIGTILLSIAAAYYIYLPLPSTISEPWKPMFMDWWKKKKKKNVISLVEFCSSWPWTKFPVRCCKVPFVLGGC